MRIGITYNLKTDRAPSLQVKLPEDLHEEFDQPETIQAIEKVLSSDGHEVHLLGSDFGIREKIKHFRIDFVFNIVEGFYGRSREAQIPALLELLGVPYSGSDPLGVAVTLDKSLAKRIASSAGILTPEFWTVDDITELGKVPKRFPLFVKPLWQGSSMGITQSSRVENSSQLKREAERLFGQYPEEPVLVEEYITGREFTAGLVGNKSPEVLGVMEIAFQSPEKPDFCYSIEVKRNWRAEVEYHVPPRISRQQEQRIEEASMELFRILRLRDFARFDFRMDAEDKLYFLEANPLAGLSPESSDLVIMIRKKGMSYEQLILRILHSAFERYPKLGRMKTKEEARRG